MKRFLAAALFLFSSYCFGQQGGYVGTPTTSGANNYTGPQTAPNVNGRLNASSSVYSGSDIGAKVNSAFAVFTGASKYGTVTLDPTQSYTQTTTIVIPRGDILDCQGATLNWNTTTGQPIIYGDATTNHVLGGIKHCNLIGTGAANSTYGMYAGGDPAGVITPASNYGDFFLIQDSTIAGFGSAFTHGSNVWAGLILNSQFYSNGNGIYSAVSGATNEGEASHVVASKIFNNTSCGLNLNNAGDWWNVANTNLDYNPGGAVCGTIASVDITDSWLEQTLGPVINITGTAGSSIVHISGGQGYLAGTGTSADMIHVEGAYQSYLSIDHFTYIPGPGTLTNMVGVGYTGTSPRTHVCISAASGSQYNSFSVNGTVLSGCIYSSPIQQQIGSTLSEISPSSSYSTANQGFNIAWNVGLNSRSGEMDFINIHGGGNGGFVWCDGSISFTPGTCQMTLDTGGNLTTLGNITAPQFYLQSITAAPNYQWWDDFNSSNNTVGVSIGSPTGQSCSILTPSVANHLGLMAVVSGTAGTGTGEVCLSSNAINRQYLLNSASNPWVFDTVIDVPVLPGTTVGAYQVGFSVNEAANPWITNATGFYLSSANAVVNDWYCNNNGTMVDSTIAATTAWTHLSLKNDGTYVHWYVNGVEATACKTALASISSSFMLIGTSSTALSATSVTLDWDSVLFQQTITR